MAFKFALRNVFRNRKRSFLTAITIFFAAIIVSFGQSWSAGLIDAFIDNYIRYQTGHIRLTTADYIQRERFLPVDEIMTDADSWQRKLVAIDGVKQVSERIRFGLLLGHKERTVEAVGMALDMARDRFDLPSRLIPVSNDHAKEASLTFDDTGVVIGYKLAKKLGVKLGDQLLIASQTSEGGLNAIKLKVTALSKFSISVYDSKYFFISLENAKKLLKIYRGSTELYVYAQERELTDAINQQIISMIPIGLASRNYRQQIGNMYHTLESGKTIYFFVEMIILFLASFVIINTMMMAIFERLREIGTLKAMGMLDRDIFINFTWEGAIIGALGGVPGTLVGFLLIVWLSFVGLNFENAVKSMDMPLETMIKPPVELENFVIALIMSVVVPAMAAMIPASYSRKLLAAEALKK